MADKKPPPKFKVGDKVTSFRGEKATVDRVRHVEHPGKSHRVGVTWEGGRGKDPVDYYETVFNDRRSPNPTDVHYREGVQHGSTGSEYKGYGGRSPAINYGAGYREGVNKRIIDAVTSKAPCPSPGCGKKHRDANAAIKAHRNSSFPSG